MASMLLRRQLRVLAQLQRRSLSPNQPCTSAQANAAELSEMLESMPLEHTSSAFAYGSGVFQQKNAKNLSQNMVDFILVVPDAEKFHAANMLKNRRHYSSLAIFGAERLAKLQTDWAARVYFNTMVPIATRAGRRLMKYGIIIERDLCDDLLDWSYLYIAGRLHKPVLWLKSPNEDSTKDALKENLKNALHTSLLLLPDSFTKAELYTCVASLSYIGDFRQYVGEDKNKIANIVSAQYDYFDAMYTPLMNGIDQVELITGDRYEQDKSPSALYHHMNLLPRRLLWMLQGPRVLRDFKGRMQYNADMEYIMLALHNELMLTKLVRSAVISISRRSSYTQTVKNALTAGVRKGAVYAGRKMLKWAKSVRQ